MYFSRVRAICCSGRLPVSGQGGACPGGCLPRGCLPKGVSAKSCVCPRGDYQRGCLPRGVSVQGGCLPKEGVCLGRVCSRGCVCPGGVCLGGRCLLRRVVSVDRMTDACESITFPQLLLRTVNNVQKIREYRLHL